MSSLPRIFVQGWALSLAAAGWIMVVVRVLALVAAAQTQATISIRSGIDAGVSPLELKR